MLFSVVCLKMGDQLANIEFVQEVEKHPVLYNYTLPGYSRRSETETAWDEVARKVNMRVDECKDKWKNIRTVFARRLRPPPRGSGPKKSYYLTDYLQFAIPFINTSKPSRGNLPEVPEVETILQEQDAEDDNNSDEVSAPTPLTRPASVLVTPPSSSPVQSGEKETDVSFGKQKRNIIAKQKAKFEDEKSIDSDFPAKKSKIDSQPSGESVVTDKREEGLKMFLLSLLPDLTQFSDSQVRTFRRKVLAVVDEIAEPPTMSSPVGVSWSGDVT